MSKRVAVIGSGISGLSAAWLYHRFVCLFSVQTATTTRACIVYHTPKTDAHEADGQHRRFLQTFLAFL